MREKIIGNLNNPAILEKLYRDDKECFVKAFNAISDNYNSNLIRFWKIRLENETETESIGFNKSNLIVVILISLITGSLVKLPAIFSQMDTDFFYQRNLAIIVFNGLILYTFWQNKIFQPKRILFYSAAIIILLFYSNLLPNFKSDSINLALIHIPLILWCLFGLAYISFDYKNRSKLIQFIRFNGELLIMTGLLIITGGLLSGVTIGLFSVINMNIEEFYYNNIAIFGGTAAPIVAFYLIKIYPNITSRISPVIARIFAPLVLITLAVYLITMFFSGSQILEDRELLLIFNVLLLAVLAIIIFSIIELNRSKDKNMNVLILLLLAVLAIVINSIALYAIITRVAEGFTPNRTVVLLSNIAIFINLVLITKELYKSYYKIERIEKIENTVAKYLNIYLGYAIFVVFILPFIFVFK